MILLYRVFMDWYAWAQGIQFIVKHSMSFRMFFKQDVYALCTATRAKINVEKKANVISSVI